MRVSMAFAIAALMGSGGDAPGSGVSTAPGLCSLAAFVWERNPSRPAFVGTAVADTTVATPGPIEYTLGDGHFGVGRDRLLYGQLVRVERLSAAAPEVLRRAVARSPEVLLVPWDYAPDCRPIPWSRSARFLPPGTAGFFVMGLRDSVYWVNGRPTFDVSGGPYFVPYPSAPGLQQELRRGRPATSDSLLTAAEMLALHDVLPDRSVADSSAAFRFAPLLRWAKAHPELARREPARTLLATMTITLRTDPEERRMRAIRSPLAGTYRFVFALPARDSVVLFARAAERPTSTLWTVSPGRQSPDSIPPAAAGYILPVVAARMAGELPRTRAVMDVPGLVQGYLNIVEVPAVRSADSTVWQGGVDLIRAAAELTAGSPVSDALKTVVRTQFELYRTGELNFAPGRFVRRADGALRFEQVIRRGGASLLTIRGERISEETLSGGR